MNRIRIVRTCRLLLTLLAVVICGFPLMITSAAEPGDPDTTVEVTDEWFLCGETGTSDIRVTIVNDPAEPKLVHGVEVQLSFDPTKLQVVDIVAEDGLFPLDEQAIVQENAAGTILFAVSRIGGDGVQDATGAIATITWEAAPEVDCATIPSEGLPSDVNVVDALMSDPDGYEITVDETGHGTIIIRPPDEDEGIVGTVKLQGRDDHSGTMVSALLENPGCCNVFTNDKGYFKTVPTEAGTYTVTAWKQGYLRARRTGVPYNPGQLTDMGTITLLGGDIVPDEVIDICDITYIASRFGGTEVSADVTGDGQVNILDLTVTAANFGQSGPTSW